MNPAIGSQAVPEIQRAHPEPAVEVKLPPETIYRDTFTNAPEGLLLLDAGSFVVIDANSAALALIECAAGDLIGRPISEASPFRDVPEIRQLCSSLQSADFVRIENLSLRTRDGGRRTVEWVASVFPSGRARIVQCGLRDLTARKIREGRVRQIRKAEALRRMAGGVAHELNNALTCIRGYSSMALTTPALAPDLREMLTLLEGSSQRAAQLARHLLDFANMKAPALKGVDLTAFLARCTARFRSDPSTAGPLNLVGDVAGLVLEADEELLEKALLSVLTYARESVGSTGEITLVVEATTLSPVNPLDGSEGAPARFVRLSIRDRGPGLPATAVERAFEPSFSTKKTAGAVAPALGSADRVATLHRGWTEIESRPGQGTSISIVLPLARSP